MAGDELPPVVQRFEATSGDFDSVVDHLEERLEELNAFTAEPDVVLQGEGVLEETIDYIEEKLEALDEMQATAHAYLDSEEFNEQVESIEQALDYLRYDIVSPEVDLLTGDAETRLAEIYAALEKLAGDYNANVTLTDDEFVSEFDKIEAMIAALERPIDTSIELDDAGFMASLAAVLASTAAASAAIDTQLSFALPGIRGPGSAGLNALMGAGASAAAADAAGGGGGGGGGGAGLLAALGFGGAAGRFGLGGLPGIGTIGSLAGFGAESLLTTGAGILGSAAGAAAGGGALALGSAGVAGVGIGTDLAGMGQAAGDAKTYTQELDKLNRAIAVYGAGSIEAKAAQYDLNNTMNALTPAAQAGVIALSQAGQQFHTLFNQATGDAEGAGAKIEVGLLAVGEKFLPTIGKFASQNMTIIQASLAPLETWMQGPGLSIFTQVGTDIPRPAACPPQWSRSTKASHY